MSGWLPVFTTHCFYFRLQLFGIRPAPPSLFGVCV